MSAAQRLLTTHHVLWLLLQAGQGAREAEIQRKIDSAREDFNRRVAEEAARSKESERKVSPYFVT